MTRVLLVGNGAREHAIAIALKRDGVDIVAHMDKLNPGIAALASEVNINTLDDPNKLPDLLGIDYAVIGPEVPLSVGVVDHLRFQGIPSIGPRLEPARIETHKSFSRRLLQKYAKDANPKYTIARSIDAVKKFEKKNGISNMVVKPDGLTGGKGVKVFGDHFNSAREMENYATSLLIDHGIVIVEEKLQGTEFTVQAFSDGCNLEFMPLVRDYKRAYDGDAGPNTGSMGSFSRADHMLPGITDADLAKAKDIMKKVIPGIKKTTHIDYKGILYGQFMKSKSGIKVIEFNARFGDPEAMNVLSVLSTPIDEVFQSIINGNLVHPSFEKKATVCVYVVPEGYPGPDVVKDAPMSFVPGMQSDLYYASVYEKEGIVHTTGSRAVALLAKADTVGEARRIAYSDANMVNGKVRYRKDIAKDVE